MWGPTPTATFKQFESIPYAPFSKSDKLGRVADWYEQEDQQQQQQQYQQRIGGNRRTVDTNNTSYGAGVSTAFAYTQEENDSSFAVVDRTGAAILPTVPVGVANAGVRGTASWGARTSTGTLKQGASQPAGPFQSSSSSSSPFSAGMKVLRSGNVSQRTPLQQTAYQKSARRFGQWGDKPQRVRETSVAVSPNWQFVEEYQLSAFGKLSSADIPAGKDLWECGELQYYDRSYDRLTVKTQRAVRKTDRLFHNVTASEDPVFRQLWQQNHLPDGKKIPTEGDIVMATAQVLAALMTAGRSVNSWDIIMRRQTDPKTKRRCLFFDKRQSSSLDYQTVSETAVEPIADIGGDRAHPNSPFPLSAESTSVSRCFSQQVLQQRDKFSLGNHANPFATAEDAAEEALASVGYRYRLLDLTSRPDALGDDAEDAAVGSKITLVCRGEVDACTLVGSDRPPSLLSLNALNEHYPVDPDTGLLKPNYGDWRSRLDTQRGAVLTEEMRNNSWKLCRWAVESILTGADQMKIGFLSRAAPLNPQAGHVLLGVQTYQPQKFAEQLGLNLHNAFGILKSLVDVGLRQPEDGRYVLLKDPSDAKVKLYRVPEDVKIPGYGDDGGVDDGADSQEAVEEDAPQGK